MMSAKEFPDGMVPLGVEKFQFSCHPGVDCFMSCCRNVDMYLYPYDILRLKNALQVDSETFMRRYTRLAQGAHPYFPAVMLQLHDNEEKACPFLSEMGCSVYYDRPSACRTYPLERAVDRASVQGRYRDFYFLTDHKYCMGHQEDQYYSVTQWIREQRLEEYNSMNDLWAELDTLFASNPWKGEGSSGPRQQMAFMVSYDVDGFRTFVERDQLLRRFALSKEQRRRIASDDAALLMFGFEWLKLFLTGISSLQKR